MALSDDRIRELMRATMATRPTEIDCDTWLEKVGGLLEIVRTGQTTPPELDIVQHHMEACADCREEFAVMLEVLDDEPD